MTVTIFLIIVALCTVGYKMAGLLDLINIGPAAEERKLLGLTREEQQSSMQGMATKALKSIKDDTVKEVNAAFRDKATAAGILGNIEHETGGSFDSSQRQNGGGPGHGLFQMEGEMKKAYGDYLGMMKDVDSARNQISFMRSILNSPKLYDIGAGNRIKMFDAMATGKPDVIAEAFSNFVERPKAATAQNDKRKEAATRWFNKGDN